jgi:hypothetical protein
MLLAITPNPVCVSGLCLKSKPQLPTALVQVSGQPAKRNSLPRSTRLLAGVTEIESTADFPQKLGRPEMAYQVGEAFVQNGRAVFARSCYQVFVASRVRRNNQGQASWQSQRQTVCGTTQKHRKENGRV